VHNDELLLGTDQLAGDDGVLAKEEDQNFEPDIDEIKQANGLNLLSEAHIMIVTSKAQNTFVEYV